MKLIRTLVLFLLLLFLCLSSAVSLFLTNDSVFKKIGNIFLAPQSIAITHVEDVDISLSTLSLSFKRLDLQYRENKASFKLLTLSYSYGEAFKKRLYHEINASNLDIYLSADTFPESKSADSQAINLMDYLPSVILKLYSGVDLWIERLSIHHETYLKQVLVFNNIDLSNKQESKGEASINLGLTSHYKNNITELLFSLKSDNYLEAEIRFSKEEFIKLSLIAIPDTLSENISLTLNQTSYLSTSFYSFLKEYLQYSDNIHSIQSKINFSTEKTIPSQVSHTEDLYYMLLSAKTKASVKSDIKFVNLPLDSLNANFNISAQPSKSQNELNQINTLRFLESNSISAKLNTKNDFFKGEPSLEFLATQKIILNIDPSTQLNITDKTFLVGKGVSINVAQNKNPAFISWELDSWTGNYQSLENFTSQINYQLNSRWNKHLASQHKGKVNIIQNSSATSGTIEITDDKLHSQLNIKLAKNSKGITGNYHYLLSNLSGKNKELNKFIAYWDKDLSLQSGTVELSGALSVPLEPKTKSLNITYNFSVDVKNMNADYDGFLFSGINTQAHFIGHNSKIASDKAFTIDVKKIDAGLIVDNFQIKALSKLDLEADSLIQFSNLNGETLGGYISGNSFPMYLPFSETNTKQKYHAEFNIKLKKLQLKQVLALAENPEIEGDGLLYGELPITVNELATLIKDGWIKNKNKGTLQYRPNQASRVMLKQNPQMALLLDVLGHLRYDELTADLNLDDSGTMTIQGHLQGVNPDFKKGYPIIFNPSLEINILNMMRSLQISDDISDKVSNKIQEKNLN